MHTEGHVVRVAPPPRGKGPKTLSLLCPARSTKSVGALSADRGHGSWLMCGMGDGGDVDARDTGREKQTDRAVSFYRSSVLQFSVLY